MATRTRVDPGPFHAIVVLWILAALAAGASFLAPSLYYGILLTVPLALLSLGLGFWGLWWAREAGFDLRFYLPVLGGLIAILLTAVALAFSWAANTVTNRDFYLYLALVLGVALFSVPALLSLWVQTRIARRTAAAA